MKNRALFLLAAVILLLSSCQKSRKIADQSEFFEYISGYTSGFISKSEPVRIKLVNGNLKFEIGKELPPGVISFEPSIKGTATMYAEDLLVFKPDGSWPADKTITATFNLGKVIDVPAHFSVFSFQFSIIGPSFSIYPGNLVSFGEKDEKMKKIEGRLIAADVMSLEEVEKLLEASSTGSAFTVKWEEGAGRNEFNFVIDSLPRLEEPYEVDIIWDGSPLDIDVKGKYTYEIPSVYDFLYLGSHLGQGEEQYIDIILSDPVNPSQDLAGLIHLKEGDQVRLVTDNNIVRLYPANRLEGDRTLIIESSLRSDSRATLKERVELVVRFEEIKPDAQFIGKGVIMPDPEGLFLPIRTVSLRAVDVIVYKIFENNIPYYLQENNFSSGNFYSFKQYGRPVYAKAALPARLRCDPAGDRPFRQAAGNHQAGLEQGESTIHRPLTSVLRKFNPVFFHLPP